MGTLLAALAAAMLAMPGVAAAKVKVVAEPAPFGHACKAQYRASNGAFAVEVSGLTVSLPSA